MELSGCRHHGRGSSGKATGLLGALNLQEAAEKERRTPKGGTQWEKGRLQSSLTSRDSPGTLPRTGMCRHSLALYGLGVRCRVTTDPPLTLKAAPPVCPCVFAVTGVTLRATGPVGASHCPACTPCYLTVLVRDIYGGARGSVITTW